MTNPEIPPVPLRLVAPYLRSGDRVRHNGNDVTLDVVSSNGNWFGNGDTYLLVPDSPITPISPRLVPAAVGEVIKAGEEFGLVELDGTWHSDGFKPLAEDYRVAVGRGLYFRLVRDEAPETIVVTRDNLSVGDVVEITKSRWPGGDGTNNRVGIKFTVGVFSGRPDSGCFGTGHWWGLFPGDTVRIVSRAQPAPAEAVATPQPDHSALREAWRFLAERTPWGTMAEIHTSRGWGGSRWSLPLVAEELFQQVLLHGDPYRRDSAHLLVVLTDNPDRPVELYSEALNSAAYHAKREEIWPTAPLKLCACGATLMGKQVTMCGDCGQSAHRRVLNSVFQCDTSRHDNRFRDITDTTPSRPIPPGVEYHLNDCGGFYSPSWEE